MTQAMASKKKTRRRRKKTSSRSGGAPVATIRPEEVPSDEQLEAEAKALEEETQGKYDLAKKDDMSLAKLQHMSTAELADIAKKEEVADFSSLSKQKLVFEILRARAQKQGLMVGEGTLEVLPDGYGFLRSPEYS